jgi:CHAT domain-containing protein
VLELNQPVERELAGGQLHKYSRPVAANQYLRIVARQQGVDIALTFRDSTGKKVIDTHDHFGSLTGIETIALVTSEAGDCTFEVSAVQKTAAPGRYTIELVDFRSPTDKDQLTAQAEIQYEIAAAAYWKKTAAGYAEAVEKFTSAIDLYRQAGDRRGEAQALDYLSQCYQQTGEKNKFGALREQSLPIWRELKDPKGEALTLNAIGTFHLQAGNNEAGLEYFRKAIEIYKSLGEKEDEAFTLNNAAVIHYAQAEYQLAFDYFQQVLTIIHEQPGQKGAESVILRNIGNVYNTWGDRQTSFEYYQRALALAREAGNSRTEAQTLEFIGRNYYQLGDIPKALESIQKALTMHHAAGNPNGEADSLANLGVIYYRNGETEKALDLLNKAMAIWEERNLRPGRALVNYHLGMAYYGSGDLTRALEAFNKSLELHRATEHAFYIGDSLRMIATIERDRGQYEAAVAHAAPAVEEIERVRQRISLPGYRASYFSTMQDTFDVYIDSLMQADKAAPGKYVATALQAVERARARTLIDTLIESNANIKAGVDPKLLEQEKVLIRQVNTQATALRNLLSAKYTEEQKTVATRALAELQKQYEAVEAQIREHSPAYAALTQPTPLSLAEVQQQLLEPDSVLLEYSLGRKRSYLFAVTKDSLKTYELPERERIEEAARRVYQAITARNMRVKFETPAERSTRVTQADKDYLIAATALSGLVLGPASDQLNAKRIMVVADGALQYVPFGALPAPANTLAAAGYTAPLIAEHEIVSLPSATTLSVLRRGLAGRPPAPKMVVALADPVFEESDVRLAIAKRRTSHESVNAQVAALQTKTFSGKDYLTRAARDIGANGEGFKLTRLPFTRAEATAIAKMTRVNDRRVELDFGASLATATSPELAQYRIVHFATHGFLDSTDPNLSGLAFSLIDKDGKPQDGFLRASEIFNLKLPADLVVLSSCRTGLGKEIRGEGLIGLTRGFMYAGAARVIVSLWDINDEGTAELMKRFYGGLLGPKKMSPAAALKAAQVSMATDRRWSSPYYWAGFTLQGEPR